MILFQNAMPLSDYLAQARKKHLTVGFVPTMGALHDGHLALIEACKKENDIAVCSIFVNPTQFNNPADFSQYPNTVERDVEQLVQADCSVLFLPGHKEIYPEPYTALHYDLGYLETVLEGKYRPGAFSRRLPGSRQVVVGCGSAGSLPGTKRLPAMSCNKEAAFPNREAAHSDQNHPYKTRTKWVSDEQPQPAPLGRTT
jgi:cytidyltransferase-like protein